MDSRSSEHVDCQWPSDSMSFTFQWWNVMQTSRVNRPTGWGFWGITNGEIKYMKLFQVSVELLMLFAEVHNILQPIAWSFSIGGNDLHIHHNKIIAISQNEVGWLTISAY